MAGAAGGGKGVDGRYVVWREDGDVKEEGAGCQGRVRPPCGVEGMDKGLETGSGCAVGGRELRPWPSRPGFRDAATVDLWCAVRRRVMLEDLRREATDATAAAAASEAAAAEARAKGADAADAAARAEAAVEALRGELAAAQARAVRCTAHALLLVWTCPERARPKIRLASKSFPAASAASSFARKAVTVRRAGDCRGGAPAGRGRLLCSGGCRGGRVSRNSRAARRGVRSSSESAKQRVCLCGRRGGVHESILTSAASVLWAKGGVHASILTSAASVLVEAGGGHP
eukprot:365381-Chlamydomonas_euryale.AAC.32